ncbi:unnamed protein product [Polarella glacialis]|uniref:Uncharacterized protein n=1 Tax=Polarella glacialis TaxID=89957 RepID=A0A813IY63_POLGL|nr:unnamed protein product [Polarella glacialis]
MWGHINSLDLRAYFQALRWRTHSRKRKGTIFFHLLDNQVCLGLCTKGRSSSLVLNSTLRRISALTLAANFYPLLGYVHMSENPSDGPSRRFEPKSNKFKFKTRPVEVGLWSAESASLKNTSGAGKGR